MVLVDANVLLDILTTDPVWAEWSQTALMKAATVGMAINPIIYAELAPAFNSHEELAAALDEWPLTRLPLPYAAAWPAAQAFGVYRRRGGSRTSPLPDFYIGAHAQMDGLSLLTRDATRYRTYFLNEFLTVIPTDLLYRTVWCVFVFLKMAWIVAHNGFPLGLSDLKLLDVEGAQGDLVDGLLVVNFI